jgi:plastocyanin
LCLALFVLSATTVAGCAAGSTRESCAAVERGLAPVTDKGELRSSGSSIDVDAANAAFTPTCVTNVPQGIVAMTIRNSGVVIHNVDIPAQHVDVDISARHSVTIRIHLGSQPVVYICRYHRALGMIGVLIPEPSG